MTRNNFCKLNRQEVFMNENVAVMKYCALVIVLLTHYPVDQSLCTPIVVSGQLV